MWKVNYHIDFNLADGQKITKNNSLIVKSPKIRTVTEAKEYILKKYKNSFQPMVNQDDIFISIKKEVFIIDCIKKIS